MYARNIWVFAGIGGAICVDVDGRSVFSGCWSEAQRQAVYRAKGKMAMSCSGILMKEVGVRCCRVEGCCVSAKQGLTFWCMV